MNMMEPIHACEYDYYGQAVPMKNVFPQRLVDNQRFLHIWTYLRCTVTQSALAWAAIDLKMKMTEQFAMTKAKIK